MDKELDGFEEAMDEEWEVVDEEVVGFEEERDEEWEVVELEEALGKE